MPGTFDKLTGTEKPTHDTLSDGNADLASNDDNGTSLSRPSTDNKAAPDNDRTPTQIRDVVKELTRYGFIEASRKPNLYRSLQNEYRAIAAILEPLDLDLIIDDVRGLAIVTLRTDTVDENQPDSASDDPDAWSHPLVRRQRLTLEQSLLVAILRQHFVSHEQEAGAGADGARVAVDELIPEFHVYMGDTGSEARERTRMLTLLDQLKGHGLVSEPDSHERVTIRPIIAHLASPENLQYLLSWLRQQQNGTTSTDQTGPQNPASTPHLERSES